MKKEVVNSQRKVKKGRRGSRNEAEQRKEECNFQLQMMYMLFGSQNTHITPEQYGPYHPFSSSPKSYEDM